MGGSSSSPCRSQSAAVTSRAEWRNAFLADLSDFISVADSTATGSQPTRQPLLPKEMLRIVIAYYQTPSFGDMLKCENWVIAKCLNAIPKVATPVTGRGFAFAWSRDAPPSDLAADNDVAPRTFVDQFRIQLAHRIRIEREKKKPPKQAALRPLVVAIRCMLIMRQLVAAAAGAVDASGTGTRFRIVTQMTRRKGVREDRFWLLVTNVKPLCLCFSQ